MNRAEILERVFEIVSDVYAVPVAQVTPESDMVLDLGGDEVQRMELLDVLGDEFEVELDEDEFMELGTPGDVVDLVEDALDQQT
ncbi:MAG: acyl carrier protein [Planctomycetota bacterium]